MKRTLVAALLSAALPLLAQGPGAPMHGRMHGPMHGFGMRQPVTNEPYSATVVETSSEKLQDGTAVTQTHTRTVARDAAGRTREEFTFTPHDSSAGASPQTVAMIFDPVAHTITRLNETTKVAYVRTLPTPAADVPGAGPNGTWEHKEHPNVTVTDLGTRTLDGVTANGKRILRTIPAGQVGNAAPVQSTREIWIASELKIDLSSTESDPFHGTRTVTVTNLNTAAPDASLFQVPEGYTVMQVTGRHFGPHTPGAGAGAGM